MKEGEFIFMAERNLVGEVIIAENGALKTFASYYEGHLNLGNYTNMGGEHVWGFTGPETRFESRRLIATRTFEVVEATPVQAEVPQLLPDQEVYVG